MHEQLNYILQEGIQVSIVLDMGDHFCNHSGQEVMGEEELLQVGLLFELFCHFTTS